MIQISSHAQQHFRRLDMRMLRELVPQNRGDVAQISRVKEARRELEEAAALGAAPGRVEARLAALGKGDTATSRR